MGLLVLQKGVYWYAREAKLAMSKTIVLPHPRLTTHPRLNSPSLDLR